MSSKDNAENAENAENAPLPVYPGSEGEKIPVDIRFKGAWGNDSFDFLQNALHDTAKTAKAFADALPRALPPLTAGERIVSAHLRRKNARLQYENEELQHLVEVARARRELDVEFERRRHKFELQMAEWKGEERVLGRVAFISTGVALILSICAAIFSPPSFDAGAALGEDGAGAYVCNTDATDEVATLLSVGYKVASTETTPEDSRCLLVRLTPPPNPLSLEIGE